MVQVGIVWMGMCHGFMAMRVRMRLASIGREVVHVLMMLIVDMQVFVFHWPMRMIVLVVFADMQPDTKRHEPARTPETEPGGFSEQQQRQCSPDEGGG